MRARTGLFALTLAAGAAVFAISPAASAAAVAPAITVTGAQALAAVHQNPHVVARDNGQSAGYGGKSVWIFDDTQLQNPGGFVSNTGAMTRDLDASDGIDLLSDNPFTATRGVPGEIIPFSDAEKSFQQAHAAPCVTGDEYCGTQFAFWPGPVVADPARRRILFSYGKLCRGAPDGSPCQNGFVGSPLGSGFAALDMRTNTVTRLAVDNPDPALTSPEGQDPTLLFGPSLSFGSGEMTIQDGILYAWGACDSASVCGLAKVPAAQIQDRLAWRYYTGTDATGTPTWGTDPSAAVSTGLINGAAGGTVQYVPAIHGYLNTFMAALTNTGEYQTAPTPWGPWSARTSMFTGLPTTSLWDYAMYAHPEYATADGLTQYLTYYRPQDGQQELVRVDFAPAAKG